MGREPTTDTPDYTIRYKPITTAPQTPDEPQGRDTFQTPNYAVDLLVPFIPKEIKVIWEPACGDGKIVNRLRSFNYDIIYSDIRYSPIIDNYTWNFITREFYRDLVDNYEGSLAIITNPPYSIKEKFIDKAMTYGVPWAMLINADYSAQQINWLQVYHCEKIIPNRRIDYITPTGRNGGTSSSQFHSMWLTHGFNLGRTETFVDLPISWKKERI